MKIVDAQVHIWGANTPSVRGRRAPSRIARRSARKSFWPRWTRRASTASSSCRRRGRAIATTSPSMPRRAIPTASASWAASIPMRPARASQLAGWKKQKGMLGVRLTFHTEVLRQPLLDGRFDWVWGEMEKHGHSGDGAVPSRIHASRRQGRRALSRACAWCSTISASRAARTSPRPPTSPPSTRCWRSPSGPTWRPRSRPCRATPPTRPILSGRCIRTSAASSTPSDPSAPSGGRTGRGCPAATARASRCSPRSCRG